MLVYFANLYFCVARVIIHQFFNEFFICMADPDVWGPPPSKDPQVWSGPTEAARGTAPLVRPVRGPKKDAQQTGQRGARAKGPLPGTAAAKKGAAAAKEARGGKSAAANKSADTGKRGERAISSRVTNRKRAN